MSSANIGIYGEELYEQVLPLHGPDPDGLLHDLIGAYVHGALEIDDLARDDAQGRPGWGVILDVDECPVKGLPWLGQIAGVTLRAPKTITRYNLVANSSAEFSYMGGYFPIDAMINHAPGGTVGSYMLHGLVNSNGLSGIALSSAFGEYADVAVAVDVIHVDRPMKISITFSDGSFNPITTFETALSSAAGTRTLTAKSPPGTEFVAFDVLIPSSVIGETFDLDAFLFSPNSRDTSYFDGFSPGGAWLSGSDPELDGSILVRLETDDEWAVYARDAIRRQGGKGRGTVDAMLSAAEDTLTGTRSGRIVERVGGNAYALELITRPSETPDPAATLAAAMTQKPAGMSLIHTLTEGAVIDEGTVSIDTATGQIDTATIADITI